MISTSGGAEAAPDLAIEFRDKQPAQQVRVESGQVDWSESSDYIHRAINVAATPFEEITVFFLSGPEDDPQQEAILGERGEVTKVQMKHIPLTGVLFCLARDSIFALPSKTGPMCASRTLATTFTRWVGNAIIVSRIDQCSLPQSFP